MADIKAQEPGANDEKSGGHKSGKIKIIAGLVCVLAAGGAYMLGTKSASKTTEAGAAATTTTIALIDGCVKKHDEAVPKTIVDLPEMSINLAGGHYLRAAVSLGLCADVTLATPDEFKTAPAKDIVVAQLTGKTMDDLSTVDGRDATRKHLTETISAAYPGIVYQVYLVEFVMQ
jgi:flagellar basal body-associated protein FliL